jgi:PAS domain S-box-containing protein
MSDSLSAPGVPKREARSGSLAGDAGAGVVHGRASTAREREEAAARVINQRLFETSLDLIVIVDRQGNIIRMSPSAETILGYRPEELCGQSAAGLLYPDDLENTRNEMRLARRGRTMRTFDCRYVRKDGDTVTLAWKGVWSEPEQQHFFIGRDMTERIRLEQQLMQSQKLEAIGQLTGGVAHDFNNILTIIIGMNEVLAGALAKEPGLAEMCKAIDEAAERGVRLAQRMLAFARKQPLETRALDVNQIVTGLVAMLRQTLGEDIGIETALAPDLWCASADPSRLEDAILNLAVNARDAMPKGGRLLLETANVQLDEHYAQDNTEVAPGDYVAVIVTDSGTGMTPEVAQRAFEPFFTTKGVGQGTGLGLSMVYGFAKQSRGHAKIYSEPGHGTSVRIYLPRVVGDAKPWAPAALEAAEAHPRGRETILVVEDDPAVRAVAVKTLESAGYDVREAADGPSGLKVLERPGKIDLLFTDLIMPNGMSGQDLLRHARQLRPELNAIFTSGYSEQFLKGRDETDRSVPLLPKPYRRQKLLEIVRKVLEGAHQS